MFVVQYKYCFSKGLWELISDQFLMFLFVPLVSSVRYDKIKFLVIALKNAVEVYAWAPKPYHKFMAFKVGNIRMKCEMHFLCCHCERIELSACCPGYNDNIGNKYCKYYRRS